jgi:acyl-CoA synthetase (AMP-forming)/AMP-acid ligase II
MISRSSLLTWVDQDDEHGIWDLAGAEWHFTPYSRVRDDAVRVANGLHDLGVRRGDRILLALPSGAGFTAALYGTWLQGAIAVPMAPAIAFAADGTQAMHVARAIAAVGASLLVSSDGQVPRLEGTARLPSVRLDDLLTAALGSDALALDDILVLQLTSGSTGTPKAVRITRECLEAQVAAMGDWMGWGADDIGSSWLPMHHDMGLVSFVASCAHGATARMMQPADFIRNPLTWLRCHGEHGAALAGTPVFGLQHVVRRVRPQQLEGLDLDFGRWRALIVGAERIDPTAVVKFTSLLAPHGFSTSTIRPAYGMAETTLAISGVRLDEPLTVRAPGTRGTDIDVFPHGRPTTADLAGLVMSCGAPVLGMEVVVVDDEGVEVADGVLGQFVVRGSSVAAGYETAGGTLTTWFEGTFETGDLGFRAKAKLHVLGRAGDGLSVRGRMVLAEDVEIELGRLPGMPYRRYCVLLGQTDGPPLAIVLAERDLPADDATRVVKRSTGPDVDVRVVRAPRGSLQWTTSGKPRRRAMWQDYVAGRLGGS